MYALVVLLPCNVLLPQHQVLPFLVVQLSQRASKVAENNLMAAAGDWQLVGCHAGAACG